MGIGESSQKFLAWIKTDGDKVYAIQPPRKDFSPEDWELLYDFSLTEGESCRVTPILPGNNNPTNFQSTVTCTNILSMPETLPIMEMQEMISSEDYTLTTHGKWINGIGSEEGVLNANGFEKIGASSVLIEAKLNDRVLYSHPAPSSVKTLSNNVEISLQGSSLVVNAKDGSVPLQVTTLDGKILHEATLTEASATIPLPNSGLFLVTTGNRTFKIIL